MGEQLIGEEEAVHRLISRYPAAISALDELVTSWTISPSPGLSTNLTYVIEPQVIVPILNESIVSELRAFLEDVEFLLSHGSHEVTMFITYDLMEALTTNRGWDSSYEGFLGPKSIVALGDLKEFLGTGKS
jgi:hypothetical protein